MRNLLIGFPLTGGKASILSLCIPGSNTHEMPTLRVAHRAQFNCLHRMHDSVARSGAAAAPAIDETITGTGRENWATRARSNATRGQSPEALEIGTVLANRYEIVRMIGEGGMGAVYQARDLQLNRLVALKVIRPDLAKDPEIVNRFKQELILARQVTHKNVIRIYDLAEFDGIKFITMDFIDG